jgi:hypothetical protein
MLIQQHYNLLFHFKNKIIISFRLSVHVRGSMEFFVTIFYGEGLLAPRPTPKLEDHPLSFVRGCLFNVFAATLHSWTPFLHAQPEDVPCRGDREPT